MHSYLNDINHDTLTFKHLVNSYYADEQDANNRHVV